VRVTGFVDSTSCADAKLVRIPANHPAGFPPPARRFRGAPGRATRILRVLFRRARSKAGQKRYFVPAVVPAVVPAIASKLLIFSPSAGHDGPLLYRVPCAAVRCGRQGPQGNRQGCRFLFVRAGSPVEKPGRTSRTCRAGCPTSAKRGGLSLWLAFSLATQRESNSGAAGARKLLLLRNTWQSQQTFLQNCLHRSLELSDVPLQDLEGHRLHQAFF
jgi:hypothetical protein